MAIYLIKEQTEKNSAIFDFAEFTQEELENAKRVLDDDSRFSTDDHRIYKNRRNAYIQFVSRSMVQVDEKYVGNHVIHRLIKELNSKYFITELRGIHPIESLKDYDKIISQENKSFM